MAQPMQDANVKQSSPLERMIQEQIMDRGIRDERVLAAMRSVPREKFFPDDARKHAFADRSTAIGHGQTISQPYMVALMTQRLEALPQHRVLEVGTGSGYQTAVLSKLAGEVYTVERLKPLLDEAFGADVDGIPQRSLSIRRRHAGLAAGGAVRSHFDHGGRAAVAAGIAAQSACRRRSGGHAHRAARRADAGCDSSRWR